MIINRVSNLSNQITKNFQTYNWIITIRKEVYATKEARLPFDADN